MSLFTRTISVIMLLSLAMIAVPAVFDMRSLGDERYRQTEVDSVNSVPQIVHKDNSCTGDDICHTDPTRISESADEEVVSSSSIAPRPESEEVPVQRENVTESVAPILEELVIVEEIVELDVASDTVLMIKEAEDMLAEEYLFVLADEIHRLSNAERVRAGIPVLEYDEALATLAALHSEDMAQKDYFSHVALEGCDLTCRLTQAEYSAWAWGENIAWYSATTLPAAAELAAFFVGEWMDSAGHRRNLLSGNFTHEGVGLVQIGDKVYATVNFLKPR